MPKAKSYPARILDNSELVHGTGCWNWKCSSSAGYGTMKLHDRTITGAHRVAYTVFVGDIPAGLEIDHLCRNRLCVNPLHLEPVTRSENHKRKPPRTHCFRGHEFTEENTIMRPGRIGRLCRECNRPTHARAKRRLRASMAPT